ncbi:hypothetical protein TWF696_003688 [Orbilia brochopaga]|uniref:RNA-dependent RNA polymerase n=1 Tax=Orbilia brochopaga TaxID=3140254 RepID=A0AAV9V6X0_9PEZI
MASSGIIIRDGMHPTEVFHLLRTKFGLPLPPDEFTEESVGKEANAYFLQVKFFLTFGRHNLTKAIAAFEKFANYENLPDEALSKASSVRSSQKRQTIIQERRLEAFNNELKTQLQLFERDGGSIVTQGSSRQSIASLLPDIHNMTDRSSSYRASTQIRDRHFQRVLEWQDRNLSTATSGGFTSPRASRDGMILDAGEVEPTGGLDIERSLDNDEEINEAFPDYIEEPTEIDGVADDSGLLPVGAATMPGGFPESTSSSSPERPAKRHSPRAYNIRHAPSSVATAFPLGQRPQDLGRRGDENERCSPTSSDLRQDESFSTVASQRTSFGFQTSFGTTQPTSFNSTMEGKLSSLEVQEEEVFGVQASVSSMLPPAKPARSQKQQLGGVSKGPRSNVSSGTASMKSRSIVRPRQYSPPSAQLVREEQAQSSRSSAQYSIGASTERDMMELVAPTVPAPSDSKPAIPIGPLTVSANTGDATISLKSLTAKIPNAVTGRAPKFVLYNTLAGEPFPGEMSAFLDELKTPFWLQYEITRVLLGTVENSSSNVEDDVKCLVQKLHRGEPISYEHARAAFRETFDSYTSKESYATRKTICGRDVFESIRMSDRKWDDRLQLAAELRFDKIKHANFASKVCRPTIRLGPLHLQNKTSRFSRHFGSDRFLVLRVPRYNRDLKLDSDDYAKIVDEFLIESGFKLLSRKWRVMYYREPKDKREGKGKGEHDWHNLVLFAEEGAGIMEPMDVRQAIEWLIPIGKNLGQTECKFWSRIKLGFSTTTSTVVFEKIDTTPDIKVGGNSLTDGCGLVSPAVLRRIKTQLELSYLPSAVQARIGPAKGLFIADPKAPVDSEELWIKTRGDQTKFEGISDDVAHRTLDVNGVSAPLSPSVLNRQFLPILLQNGVPYETFEELLREDIRRQIGDLLGGGRLDDPIFLRGYIEKIKLLASRHRIETLPTMGRLPKSNAEKAVFWLESGFTLKNPLLRAAFLDVLKYYCEDIQQNMHITIPQSCTALCVADPSGKLKKGQVYLRFGEPRNFVDEKTMLPTDVVLGEVLVGRNPALFASDIQRVTAVDVPELRYLTDVIVFSADPDTCDRSLADYLSGGDYDGDRVWTCWDPRVVNPYVNSQLDTRDIDVKAYLKQDTSTMRSRFSSKRRERSDVFTEYVKCRIKNIMQENRLGLCTNYYDRVVYRTWPEGSSGGVNHPEAQILAALCGKLVDAPKQGDELRKETWKEIEQRYRHFPQPLYRSTKPNSNAMGERSNFPLDKLRFRVAPAEIDSLMTKVKGQLPTEESKDSDITGYYYDFESRWEQIRDVHGAPQTEKSPKYWGARAVLKNLNYLNNQLEVLYAKWKDYFESGGPNIDADDDDSRMKNQNFVEECLNKFVNILPQLQNPDVPPTDLIENWAHHGKEAYSEWSKIRAAAVYRKCGLESKFPWAMAASDLAWIKLSATSAESSRTIRSMREDLYLSLKTKGSAMTRMDENLWTQDITDEPREDVDNVDWDD